VLVERDGLLRAHHDPFGPRAPQQICDVLDDSRVAAADGRHVDDRPLDQLDTRVGRQNPALAHEVIVAHRQAAASRQTFGHARQRMFQRQVLA
jgi:hypothetical protein